MSESKQFSNLLLVTAYDSINALGDDADFWLRETKKLSPETIVDFGCGTGILTCELASLGYSLTGVDPYSAMLDVARQKPNAENVTWIAGDYTKLIGIQADLLLMTSHVAQFLLSDKEWLGMLKNAHTLLNPGGHIMFDTRRSLKESFEKWPSEQAKRQVSDPALGEIEYWCKVLETTDTLATYELHYHFLKTDEVVISEDTIIFRPKNVIEKSLNEAGFIVKNVYGDWNSSQFTDTSPEMLFIAQKS